MYYKEKVIVDTKKFHIEEIYERYKKGMIIFPERREVMKKRRNYMIREIMEALLKRIPFPVVYASEQKTGELLIFDKSNRLRYLMEYLDNRYGMDGGEIFSYYRENVYFDAIQRDDPKEAREILYSEILFYIIDYMNPKYMHMQVGSFLEEWTVSQEQSIRNILYKGKEINVLENLLSESKLGRHPSLLVQYDFTYFIMFHMVASERIEEWRSDNCLADKFQLFEIVLDELQYVETFFLQLLCRIFDEIDEMVKSEMKYGASRFLREPALKVKYMCFYSYFMANDITVSAERLMMDRSLSKIVEECDMGYKSICQSVERIRRELL